MSPNEELRCKSCGSTVKFKDGHYLGSDGQFRNCEDSLPGDKVYCALCMIKSTFDMVIERVIQNVKEMRR